MTHPILSVADDVLCIDWPHAPGARYPGIWLRDNCPDAFHPQTGERMQDLLKIPPRPGIAGASVDGDSVVVHWAGGDTTPFPLDWLKAHRPGQLARDPADVSARTWEAPLDIPRHDAGAILSDVQDAAADRKILTEIFNLEKWRVHEACLSFSDNSRQRVQRIWWLSVAVSRGGSAARHASVTKAQRGLNRHPSGKLVRAGTVPGIAFSLVLLIEDPRRGMEFIRPAV